VPRGQLGVVRGDRAGADDHRVAQGAHAVQVLDVFLARDVLRFARVCGDEPVEALAEVTDRHRPRDGRAADGQVQIDEGMTACDDARRP
jgi:hypothetical protein